jgi:SPX domain protein involved in polyphosphate accumulation
VVEPITDEAAILQSAGSAMADGDEESKLIRELSGSPQELEFFKKLQGDVQKVSAHYQTQEALLLATYRQTIAAVEAFCEKYVVVNRQDASHRDDARQREIIILQTSIVRLFSALIQLENYAHLNYEGIGKALKKHDKITGRKCKMRYMASVNTQSWAQFPVLLQMLRSTEEAYKLLASFQQKM